MKVSIIGLDIAKNVFHAVEVSATGSESGKTRLRRAQVLGYFAKHEPCVVGIEACGGAHYWAREIEALGHEVRLVAASKARHYAPASKNDFNDARGIAEAVSRKGMRLVAVKTVEQQDIQAVHRLREATKKERTAHVNRLRGLLYERGIVIAVGIAQARRRIPELLEDGENALTGLFRELLAEEYEVLCTLDERMKRYDRRLRRLMHENEDARRLSEVCGAGPVLSTALVGEVGRGRQFDNGRGLSAVTGLVPRQHTTGGKPRLGPITKRGNAYLRSLFVNGARSVLARARHRDDPLSRWALGVAQRRGFNVAVVALANKLARICWVVLAKGERFDPQRV